MSSHPVVADELAAHGDLDTSDPNLGTRVEGAAGPLRLTHGGTTVGVVLPMDSYERLARDVEELEFQLAVLQGYKEAEESGWVAHERVMSHFAERPARPT